MEGAANDDPMVAHFGEPDERAIAGRAVQRA
jgi:hypothetical protein